LSSCNCPSRVVGMLCSGGHAAMMARQVAAWQSVDTHTTGWLGAKETHVWHAAASGNVLQVACRERLDPSIAVA
jgi:hypothetical protein